MRCIDSHCHLELPDYGAERDAVMDRARAAGIARFIAVGSGRDLSHVDNAVALAEAHPDVFAAIGIHPHDVARITPPVFEAITRLSHEHPRVVAVGETGLDYHYDHSPREEQRRWFREFIRLARAADKPLTLHIRSTDAQSRTPPGDAHGDALAIADEERAFDGPVVVHCFTGTPDEGRRWTARGAYLSFSGILTFKTAGGLREAAAEAPADRVLVETDCPYLAPLPYRGKRNEPAYVVETLRVLAAVRRLTLDDAARITVENTERAFRLPAAG